MNRHFALVPAAGNGTRFGAATPKQYLPLLGRPLIWHTLSVLCACPALEQVCVILAPDDTAWNRYDWTGLDKLQVLRCGGNSRADSVRNGLAALAGTILPARNQPPLTAMDWILVHDAARPGLSPALLAGLISALREDAVGGLLAVPVADTLKRADAGLRVSATLDRQGLWQAQTPQMFRYGPLQQALQHHPEMTDEAGAIEADGLHPQLVPGALSNLKVTYPADLELAARILQDRPDA